VKTLARQQYLTELVGRLRTVRPDGGSRWGKMSAHQMICHLGDACRMATGAIPVIDVSRWHQRTLVKFVALYLPLPWPKGVPTVPEIDQHCAGTKPVDFASDVAAVEALLELIATRKDAWPLHPIFGRMSEADWLRWAYIHTDHHLRQFGA